MKLIFLLLLLPSFALAVGWEGQYQLDGTLGGMKISSCEGTVCRVLIKSSLNDGRSRCQMDGMFNLVAKSSTQVVGSCEVMITQKAQDVNLATEGQCSFCEGGMRIGGYYSRTKHAEYDSIIDSSKTASITSQWRGIKVAEGMSGGIEIKKCSGTVCEVEFDPSAKDGSGSCKLNGKLNFYKAREAEGKIRDCELKLSRDFEGNILVLEVAPCPACDQGISLSNTYSELVVETVTPTKKNIVENAKDGHFKAAWRKIKAFIKQYTD